MTNTIALWLGIVIVAIFAADYFVFGQDLLVIVGIQVLRIIEWVAFWR